MRIEWEQLQRQHNTCTYTRTLLYNTVRTSVRSSLFSFFQNENSFCLILTLLMVSPRLASFDANTQFAHTNFFFPRVWVSFKRKLFLLCLKKTMDENGNTIIKTKPRTGARRVLVTGGAGFVGSHLCDALVAVRDYFFFFSSSRFSLLDRTLRWMKTTNFRDARWPLSSISFAL